jgi:Transposase, Mutator family
MGKGISKPVGAHERQPVSLSELIHQHVRVAIETAVHEELRAALGTMRYERNEVRRGYRNGIRERTLTDRPARSHSRCLAPPSSEAPVGQNGPRRSSRAISGECRRSMKR